MNVDLFDHAFVAQMNKILGSSEAAEFFSSYDDVPVQSLKVNPLRMKPQDFAAVSPFPVQAMRVIPGGYTFDVSVKPGLHPFHDAGVYYVQEPSAMATGELLPIEPGDAVLDLCAAPGGKAWVLAQKVLKDGFFCANEVVPSRAMILAGNLERMGLGRSLVLNERPERLENRFAGFFDKILVDAPCSGEGMFRKNPQTISQWSPNVVASCAQRQNKILHSAATMLKDSGMILYSTCTFNETENERVVDEFLQGHPEFQCVWVRRFYPHRGEGEGQFAALLQKSGVKSFSHRSTFRQGKKIPELAEIAPDYLAGTAVEFGGYLVEIQDRLPDLRGLSVVRAGLQLYRREKGRIAPAHALAMAIQPTRARHKIELTLEQAQAYLAGDALAIHTTKGIVLLCYQGFALGFGKAVDGRVQNYLPKGLRRTR